MSDPRPVGAGRDLGLDAFRGLTVLLMAIVNLQGDGAVAFSLLAHAEWDGLTFADLVFPWFLLAVGLSVPLAFRAGRPPVLLDVVRRVAVLFVIGVVLGWLIRPTLELEQVRWVGVLQRIAVVYLACVLVAGRSSGPLISSLLAALCLVVHSLALLLVAAPAEPGPSLAMGQGFSAWVDQTVVPGRLHRGTWDPEGAWSTLSAIGTGLIGVAVARLNTERGGKVAAGAALFLALAGLALIPLLPLNKALWTASYALVATGSGVALWLGLRRIVAMAGPDRPLAPLVFAGQTALTFFVAHMLLIAILVRKVSGETLWSILFGGLQRLTLPDAVTSLVFAIIATGIALAPVPWLKQRGWLIRA